MSIQDKPFDANGKTEKQKRIDKIVAEEIKKQQNRKRRDSFWKSLTILYLFFALTIYAIILTGGSGSSPLNRALLPTALILGIVLALILFSPKAASWLVGIENREKRRKEFNQ